LPREATRILLKNADQLGTASHPKLQDSLYTHIAAPEESVRGMFTELVRQATETQKMLLDENDMLHLPLSLKSHGTCPMNHSYQVDDSIAARFKAFNDKVEDRYKVQLSKQPKGILSLEVQFFINAIILAEPFISARAHDHIRFLIGNASTR